jgi:hypothetical protein
MKLNRRIVEQKIDRLDKLSKAERRRALANPEHLVSIGENSAFKEIEEACPRTPSWESLREKVLKRAAALKDQRRPRFTFAIAAPRWYAGAALAAMLVAIVWVVAMLAAGSSPAADDQLEATGRRVVVHYADSKNLFGHVFSP